MTGLCPVPISWERLGELVEEGTVESLGKLGRSESQLSVYKKFMAGVRNDYVGVADFIKISVFEAAVHTLDGKKHAVDSEQSGGETVVWRLNDFPYNFEPGIHHWLLWSTKEIPGVRVAELIAARFPAGGCDVLHFTNPPSLQSVLSVWHCHVLVRDKAAGPGLPGA